MLLRHGLLAVIVITIVVSLVPLPSEALEVHELEEYGVEEPLPETPPRSLQGGRSDASVADAIVRRSHIALSGALVLDDGGCRLLRRRLELAHPGGARGDPIPRPRSALASNGRSNSPDPL